MAEITESEKSQNGRKHKWNAEYMRNQTITYGSKCQASQKVYKKLQKSQKSNSRKSQKSQNVQITQESQKSPKS